ncbi:MAG TPA: hypothetical protein VN945_00310, partial [Gemmatimonadales bacterium]|nr:hypothetical protein [Gemmatimonadales bacterium]
LYERMDDVTTLIGGPSGTGKEVVARAIGLSRYIPFDARAQRFAAHFRLTKSAVRRVGGRSLSAARGWSFAGSLPSR